ncbi:MAG: multicopper oxidase domain-containing protein [Actinomycetales bacterium]
MRQGFSPWRDLPAMVWLIAIPVVVLVDQGTDDTRWLLVHLLLLGAATHSIVVWSQHFADALLHVPSTRRPGLLALLTLGTLGVLIGVQTTAWAITLAGGCAVGAAVVWHAIRLLAQLRRALPSRFSPVVRYYVTASAMLPVGVTFGLLLARNPTDPWHARLLMAHAVTNLLGWVGLTVAGTLVTLWPTMLRTRLGQGAEASLRRALSVLAVSVVVSVTASLSGLWVVAAGGVGAYLAGVLILGRPILDAARGKPPAGHPAWSVSAGLVWLVGCLVAWIVILAVGGPRMGARFDSLVPFLAVGFAAQVLLGALGYLVPSVLGGGGRAVRAGVQVLDRAGAFRIAVVNLALFCLLLPAPAAVRIGCAVILVTALTAQLPLLVLAMRASRRARRTGAGPERPNPATALRRRRIGLASAGSGVGVVLLTVAAGFAASTSPGAFVDAPSQARAASTIGTGHTTTVTVEAVGMRFVPARVEVPAGDRLVIDLRNTDTQVHDLVLANGADSGRLAPGDDVQFDAGVITDDLDGWCSVIGHRQLGMTLQVVIVGASGMAAEDSAGASRDAPEAAADPGRENGATYDPSAEPDAGFTARDPELTPLSANGPQTHEITLTVQEVVREVAPDVRQRLWTYNGQAPGPVLHGRVGDTFVVQLVNDASIGHSIDFHAGQLAPDGPMRTIAPGESLTYRFTATRAGIWMYHCSTAPMSAHIANGMFGAVVIEPAGLPPVDRSLVLVQSEQYYGTEAGPVDADKVWAQAPDAVAFNGYANQYDHDPAHVRAGERIRIWVLDAGPSRSTSFHVVGAQFSTTWAEGDYLLRDGGPDGSGGAQALALAPAQGGFVELQLDEPGHYPFISHLMVDAERGAHGVLVVDAD